MVWPVTELLSQQPGTNCLLDSSLRSCAFLSASEWGCGVGEWNGRLEVTLLDLPHCSRSRNRNSSATPLRAVLGAPTAGAAPSRTRRCVPRLLTAFCSLLRQQLQLQLKWYEPRALVPAKNTEHQCHLEVRRRERGELSWGESRGQVLSLSCGPLLTPTWPSWLCPADLQTLMAIRPYCSFSSCCLNSSRIPAWGPVQRSKR